jgi:hypothetical protein
VTQPYHPYYLGPVGGLVAISLAETITPDILSIAAVNTSIDGTATVERFGSKRSWKLAYLGLDETLESMITMALGGALAGPLYLIDPLTTNTLSPVIASTGSMPYTANPVTTTSPGLAATFQATDATFPVTPRHSQQISLVNTSGSNQSAFTPAVPVRATAYAFSVYVKSTGGNTTVRISDGTSDLATVTTSGTAWTRYTVTGTSSTGIITPYFVVPNGVTAKLGAAQLELGTVATAWKPGGGSAKVYVSSVDRGSSLWPYRDNTVTIVEV